MGHNRFRTGSELVQNRFRTGSELLQNWFRTGSELVPGTVCCNWLEDWQCYSGLELVQNGFRTGSETGSELVLVLIIFCCTQLEERQFRTSSEWVQNMLFSTGSEPVQNRFRTVCCTWLEERQCHSASSSSGDTARSMVTSPEPQESTFQVVKQHQSYKCFTIFQ